MENKNILHDKEIAKLADVLEKKTYMTFENPELKEVVFDYGDFGDLTVKDSGKNGNGMIHVIQRRSEIDGLNSETIANLLLKIAEIAKTEKITGYDETGTRAFINKDGIRVILQKDFQTENNKKGTWLISGYGIFSKEHELNLEATETIETVNAQYGYKPDHSRLRNQVGAVIASINNIRQKQLAVKKEKESIKVENGTKQITTQNAMTVYARAVLKERPSFVSDKELITAFAAANYAKNALTNGSQSQMLKKTKNRKLIEIAGSQTLIDAYEKELISRGYTLNVQNTFSETNVNYSRTVRVNISEGKERVIEALRNESQEQENLRTEPSSSPTDDIQQVSPSVNNEINTLTEEQHEEFLNDFRNVLSPRSGDFFDYIKKINYKPTLEDYKAFLYAGCVNSFAEDGIHFAFEIMSSDIQEEIKKDTAFVIECVEAAKANLNNDNWDGWYSPNKEDWQMSGFIKIMTFAGEEENAQKFLQKTHIDAINTYIPRKAYEEYVKDWKKEHDYKEGVSEPASFDEFMTNEYREHEIVKGLLSEENYKNYLQLEIETFRECIENRAEISLEKAEFLSSYLREENSKDKRPTAEQIVDGVENGWDFEDVCRGYIESTNDFLPNVLTIQRIDDMMVFASDEDAAIQAEKDGIKLIAKNELHFSRDDDAKHYRYIDTAENRRLLQEAGYIKEQKNISEETERSKVEKAIQSYTIQRLKDSLKPEADFEYTNEYERLNKYEVGIIDSELIKAIYPEKSKSWNLSKTDYADIYADLDGDIYIQICSTNRSAAAGNFEYLPFEFAEVIREDSLNKARAFLKERFEHNFIPKAEWSSVQFGGDGGDYYIGTIDGNTVKAFEPRVENLEDKIGNPVNFYGKVFSDTEGSILVELWDKDTGDIIHPIELLPDEYVFPKVSKEFKEKAIESINQYRFTEKLDWTYFDESDFKDLQDRLKEMKENPQQLFDNERAGILQIGDLQIDVNADKERHEPRYIDFEVFYLNPNGDREFNGDINDTGRKALGEDALPLKYSKDEDNVMSAVFVDDEKTPKIEEMDFYDFKNFIGNHIYQQMKDNPLIENALEKENVSWGEEHVRENIEHYKTYEQGYTRTYSVNFNCGFTFPKDIQNDSGKKEEYRWKVFEELKKQYGFNENDTETQYFDDKNSPANDSFNINFAAPVPEEIRDSKVSVDKWIDEVETYLEDNYGAYIKWEGGERVEEIVKKENIEPKIEFVFTDPEDISIDERTNMVQMRVFNSDDKYELEKMIDLDFDTENDSISFYYFKDLKTGSEYINWVNHTANPNREGYIGTSDLPQEIKNRIFAAIRPVFEKEYDSLSYDKIISGGLKENILTDSKETFLKDTGYSENAYKKVIEEIKKESVEELKEDFITAISHGNNNLIKELVPSVNSDDKQILASGLFTALVNNNTEAWKTILDTEKVPGEIIEHKISLLHDAAADLNVELIEDVLNRYEYKKEILSKLAFDTEESADRQKALDTAISRWHDIEADFSDKEIPEAIKLLAQIEDFVTDSQNISVLKDPVTGNYMTVNSLTNGYETNIFDKNKNLITHDTMDGYRDFKGKEQTVLSKLEAAFVTMQAEQGKNWSNWKKFEIIHGPERQELSLELENIAVVTFVKLEEQGFESIEAYNQHKYDEKLLSSLTDEDENQIDALYTKYNIDNINNGNEIDKTLASLSYAKLKEVLQEQFDEQSFKLLKKENIEDNFLDIATNSLLKLDNYYVATPLVQHVPEIELEDIIGKRVYAEKMETLKYDLSKSISNCDVENIDVDRKNLTAKMKVLISPDTQIFKAIAQYDMEEKDDFFLLFDVSSEGKIENLTLELMNDKGECRSIFLEEKNGHSPEYPLNTDLLNSLKKEVFSNIEKKICDDKEVNLKEYLFLSPEPGASFEYPYDSDVEGLTNVLNNNHEFVEEPELSVRQVKTIMYYLKAAGKHLYIDNNKGNLCIYDDKNFIGKGELTDNAEIISIAQNEFENHRKTGVGLYSDEDEGILNIPFYKEEYPKFKEKFNKELDSKMEAKSVTERYVNFVKKILHDEDIANKGWTSENQPVEKILVAAQKALSAFSNEEKAEISKFLLSKGAKDSASMGNILKKSISDRKSPQKERDERNLPER